MPAGSPGLSAGAAGLAALVVVAVSCTASPAAPQSPGPSRASAAPASGSMRDVACSLPREWLLRTARGYRADRSGEVQILPVEGNVMGAGLPHAGPWDYVQRVPLFLYGPGFVRSAGSVDRPVTVADVAPTEAELLGFPFGRAEGRPLEEAIVPEAERPDPPKLIVTMVWDAGGRDVLEEWPDAWPFLRSLIPKGAWYERATIGSSPSQTAQIHATIGTGVFPATHGLVSHRFRLEGEIRAPWADGPGAILRPTLADLYDRANGNGPVVGEVAGLSIQLGMMGHGAMWEDGDRDIAVIRQREDAQTLGAEGESWSISDALARYYRLPDYVNEVGDLQGAAEALDREDGEIDGRWRGNDIEALLHGYDTPARIPYETQVVEEVIRREGFGTDAVPDLLFVNYKIIDYISHSWNMSSPEMADAVAWHDRSLREFLSFLDREVGRGEWALVLTADHGATPPLEASGGLEISPSEVKAALARELDTDGDDVAAIQYVTHTQVYVDADELGEQGRTLTDVAREAMRLTAGEVGVDVPPGREGEPVFRAAYPSTVLDDLSCLKETA